MLTTAAVTRGTYYAALYITHTHEPGVDLAA